MNTDHRTIMPSVAMQDMALQRRDFLRFGATASMLLASASGVALLSGCSRHDISAQGYQFLRSEEVTVLSALAPVLLKGAWPTNNAGEAQTTLLRSIDGAIYHTSPDSQEKLHQLFDLLTLAPTRSLIFGLWRDWPEASEAQLMAFIDSCRHSKLEFFRLVYMSLVRVVEMCWYLEPATWADLGYIPHKKIIDAPADAKTSNAAHPLASGDAA